MDDNRFWICAKAKPQVGLVNTLLQALEGLLGDIQEYQRINHLGGENNHWQVKAREAIALARQYADSQQQERTKLAYDVEEYLHWWKVNPQIKGGENYLKRSRQSLEHDPSPAHVEGI